MAKSKLVQANEKIERSVVNGYRKIEGGVVNGYKKIEEGVVGGFNKITDKFVDNFLTKEGESVEEAKARLAAEQKAREDAGKEERKQKLLQQNTIIEENEKRTQNAVSEARRKAGLE